MMSLHREHRVSAALRSLAALEAHCLAGHGTMPLPSRALGPEISGYRPATSSMASKARLPYCGAVVASEGPPPMIISELGMAPRPRATGSTAISTPSLFNPGQGGRGSEDLLEQQKAIGRIADYPRRVERLKRLWTTANADDPSTSTTQGRGPRRSTSLVRAGASAVGSPQRRNSLRRPRSYNDDDLFEGGPLTVRQIRELMTRELTPEDYELLGMLDEGIKKAPTLSLGAAAALPVAKGAAWAGEECRVCLCTMDEGEDVRELPCKHWYHGPCIERWLTGSRSTCPVCGAEVMEGG